MVKIIILDDHEMFGLGVARIIETELDMTVEKVFTNPDHLTHYIDSLTPDVVLCDIKIKEVNGLNLIKTYSKKYPKIKFIVLSGYNLEEYKTRAYENGAAAFILKDESTDKLVDAIRTVHYFNKSIKIDSVLKHQILSEKEKAILCLIAKDMTNKDISEELFMSKRTVEYHISNLIRKLGVESRVGAVIKGINLGIVEEHTMR